MPRLENWSVVASNPYAPPELQRSKLSGKVFNHSNSIFKDGDKIITSGINGKNEKGQVIMVSGNVYDLGEIDPEYEKLFPDARDRFLDTLSLLDTEPEQSNIS